MKTLLTILIILVCLWVLTMVVYFFNLDMKMMAALEPVLSKWYDHVKRDRKL